jgi:hypothetical protein
MDRFRGLARPPRKIEAVAAPSTLPPPIQAQIDAPAPLRLWHLTSLDAPTVAVVWSMAFAWTAHIALPIWLPVVLALAGWSFYIADRLLDARAGLVSRANSRFPSISLLRPRHYFHWKHRRIFLPMAILAAVTATGLVLHSMPIAARARNSMLALAAMAYFTSVHSPRRLRPSRLRLPKELLVGVLFTLSCTLPVWTRAAHRELLIAPILVYAALAWLNCLAIETWESGHLTRSFIFRGTLTLAAVSFASAAAFIGLLHSRLALLLLAAAVSATLLALLDRNRDNFDPTALRAAADLVLLTPLALLLLP